MLSTVHSFLQANFAFQSKPGSFGYVQNMGEKGSALRLQHLHVDSFALGT